MRRLLPVVLTWLLANQEARGQSPAPSETITVFTTNYVPRHLTNVIRVTIPTNYFYEEFRTNWFRDRHTNIVNVFRTNRVTEFQTNLEYVTQFVTNSISIQRTNLEIVTLTNWQTVVVFKTNQLELPLTNLVKIAAGTKTAENAVAATAPATTGRATSHIPQPPPTNPGAVQAFEIELAHTAKPLKPDQFPIRLTLHNAGDKSTNILAAEWRVEGGGGGVFMVGSRPEFTGSLAAGVYKVTARLRNEDGSFRSIRAEVQLTSDGQTRRFPALSGVTGR